MIIYCINCASPTDNPKFCSRSCSASFNNRGIQRHGRPLKSCLFCENMTRNKFCSRVCSSRYRHRDADPKLTNRLAQSRYRAKGYRRLHPDADPIKIKTIYKNCPEGYEVDHIIPLSLGGWHHEDNLQYLLAIENRRKSNKFIG